MEDLESLKEFINQTDFEPSVKKALFEAIMLQFRNGSQADFQRLIKETLDNR